MKRGDRVTFINEKREALEGTFLRNSPKVHGGSVVRTDDGQEYMAFPVPISGGPLGRSDPRGSALDAIRQALEKNDEGNTTEAVCFKAVVSRVMLALLEIAG